MSACPRTTRDRAETAAAELRDCDGCLAVDVLDPVEGTRACWSLEFVTESGLTPAMLLTLARADSVVPDVSERGDPVQGLAVF